MRRRLSAVLTLTLILSGTLMACSSSDPREELAAALAKGLSDLKFSEVAFDNLSAGAADATATRIFNQLDGLHPTVAAGAITESGSDKATAALTVTWKFDGHDDWKYATTAELVKVDDVWKATWSPKTYEPSLEDGQIIVREQNVPVRAGILSGSGEEIVISRPVVRIGIDKTRVSGAELESSSKSLASSLDLDPDTFLTKVNAAGPKAFVEAITLRDEDRAAMDANFSLTPGVREIADSIPLAPTRTFARSILGSVGEATAEIIEKSDGKIVAGEQTGLSGIQAQYNDQLRGDNGFTLATQTDGADPTVVHTQAVKDGTPIKTTLDIPTQVLAESLLDPVEPASAIVAIRPSTGEILAAASGPGSQGRTTATASKYAPGSTFKVVSALGMLRAGLTSDSVVPCTPTISVDGRTFKNFPDYPAGALGEIPLRTAFANSCNTAFISQREIVSQEALKSAAESLGTGGSIDLGIPAFFGSVPTDGKATDHAASMMGQARVEMSPLAMAVIAASVAKGETVRPVILPEIAAPKALASTLTAAEAEQLRALMGGVVTDGGAKLLAALPAPPVLAKTGTAEYGTETPLKSHAWMIAIHGDLAVAVFVETGDYGSTTAGPILKEFLIKAAL